MCKMIDKELENPSFLNRISEIEKNMDDEAFFAQKAESRGTRKPANRAERRKATAHAKNRRKELAEYADDPWYGIEFNHKTGNVKRWAGFAVENKVKNRKTRYEGKNLDAAVESAMADEYEIESDLYWAEYEVDIEWSTYHVVDDLFWFDHYDESNCQLRHKTGYSLWHNQLSIWRASGFYEAKELVRLNHEVEIIEAKKRDLLEEYADKIETLNAALRSRYDQMAVVKGEEPPYQF